MTQQQRTTMIMNHKDDFLQSLDTFKTINGATEERSTLLQQMVGNKINVPLEHLGGGETSQSMSMAGHCHCHCNNSLQNPGLKENFNEVAAGNWKVIYAPHMTSIAGLLGGKLDVQYLLHNSQMMESHAKFDFPFVGRGYLSVSGTYDSVDGNVSRVDFDKAWIKLLSSSDDNDGNEVGPYSSLDEVPDSPVKDIINAVGKTFFIEQVSVFPISFLDNDMIVFEFPLLGTKVCATKQD